MKERKWCTICTSLSTMTDQYSNRHWGLVVKLCSVSTFPASLYCIINCNAHIFYTLNAVLLYSLVIHLFIHLLYRLSYTESWHTVREHVNSTTGIDLLTLEMLDHSANHHGMMSPVYSYGNRMIYKTTGSGIFIYLLPHTHHTHTHSR